MLAASAAIASLPNVYARASKQSPAPVSAPASTDASESNAEVRASEGPIPDSSESVSLDVRPAGQRQKLPDGIGGRLGHLRDDRGEIAGVQVGFFHFGYCI